METDSVRLRARSNSAESWEATNGLARSSARHTWQTTAEEDFAEKQSSTEDNSNSRQQDNYLQSAKIG